MKALSVRQPWAWALANGFKDIENRTWPTRHRGRFLIHAGKSFDLDGYRWIAENFPSLPLPALSEFASQLGGVVGVASLADCLPPGSAECGRCNSPWYSGNFGFVVVDACPLAFHPINGRLGFFEIPGDLLPFAPE